MRKRILLMCSVALLLCWAAVGLADDEGAFVEGTASVGAHYTDVNDNPQRVGEFANLGAAEDVHADMLLDMFGGKHGTLYNIHLLYRDTDTKGFDFGLKTESNLSASFGYGSFVHNLDHDLLQNMQAREANADGTPAGKAVYHTDNDPLGRYYLEYENFHGDVKLNIPGLQNGQISLGFANQHKSGYKQAMTIDHCAFCHVESYARRVDRETKTWHAGVTGTVGAVSAGYDFTRTDYNDLTSAPQHHWKQAIHPVLGTFGSEFASRDIFSDVTLPYARGTDNEKTSHNASLKLDLKKSGTVKGSYTHTRRENNWTGVQSKFDAGAVGYAVKLSPRMRLTGKFLAYQTKVDDYFIDLPNFRAGDLVGGNLDFDWTRISAANRNVYQGDLNLGWKVARGKHLKLNWRYQIIDRDAMAQSQTTYLFDGVNTGNAGATLVPSEAYANKTKINRLKARLDSRLGMKGNVNLTYAFTSVDKPFMNPTAMCEESLQGTNSSHVDAGPIGRIYYFQRQRFGNGTSMPNQAHKVTARGSYQLSAQTSVNAFFTYAKDKNDDLNVYQLDRDMITPGVNLWTAPSDKVLFTLGWTYNRVTSNAHLCPPLFDG